MIKLVTARVIMANRELRGMRMVLIRLVSSAVTLFLSIGGMVLVLADRYDLGLVVVLLNTGLLSVAMGLPAIASLATIMSILQRRR